MTKKSTAATTTSAATNREGVVIYDSCVVEGGAGSGRNIRPSAVRKRVKNSNSTRRVVWIDTTIVSRTSTIALPAKSTSACTTTLPAASNVNGGELVVTVDESLHVDLAGWAEPVGRVELSGLFAARLAAAS